MKTINIQKKTKKHSKTIKKKSNKKIIFVTICEKRVKIHENLFHRNKQIQLNSIILRIGTVTDKYLIFKKDIFNFYLKICNNKLF